MLIRDKDKDYNNMTTPQHMLLLNRKQLFNSN